MAGPLLKSTDGGFGRFSKANVLRSRYETGNTAYHVSKTLLHRYVYFLDISGRGQAMEHLHHPMTRFFFLLSKEKEHFAIALFLPRRKSCLARNNRSDRRWRQAKEFGRRGRLEAVWLWFSARVQTAWHRICAQID